MEQNNDELGNIPDFDDELDFSAGLNYGEDDLLVDTSIVSDPMYPTQLPEQVNPTRMPGEVIPTASTVQSEDSNETTRKQNEGFRDKIYKDSLGYDTIGYGHKLTAEDKKSGRYRNGISQEEAQKLFEKDETLHTAGLYRNAPWAKEQPQEVQDVLRDMAYNMGPSFIRKWPQFAKQIREGRYKEAADNMLGTPYAKQVGDRAKRNAEKLRNL